MQGVRTGEKLLYSAQLFVVRGNDLCLFLGLPPLTFNLRPSVFHFRSHDFSARAGAIRHLCGAPIHELTEITVRCVEDG